MAGKLAIYLDESGDLGFSKPGASKYFLITLLLTKEEHVPRRIIKKIRQRKLKKKLAALPEIKANNSTEHVRRKVLSDIAKSDVEIFYLILDKKTVYEYLRTKQTKIYHYIAHLILSECNLDEKEVALVIDKREKKKIIREDFDKYIKNKHKECANLYISHFDSKNSEGLQATDFVSWAIFRKYEFGDDSYFNIIKDKIIVKKELFK